jgi:FlaA1/EpsC-like NDP-sugar epimerase
VKELRSNPQVGLTPVAFVDDDPRKSMVRILGVPVVGTLAQIPGVLERYRAGEVIIAMPTAPGKVVRELVLQCGKSGVRTKTMPGLLEILMNSSKMSGGQTPGMDTSEPPEQPDAERSSQSLAVNMSQDR